MAVQVGIVNYNAGAYLDRCVQALLNSPLVGDVYIVDNASSDDSLLRLEGGNFPTGKVHVIRNDRNHGFAHGVNQFLISASAEYLLILNPDCLINSRAIATVCGILDSDPEIGMVGCLLLNPDGTEQRGGRRKFPDPWSSLKRVIGGRVNAERGFDLVNTPLPDHPVEVEAISGAFMLVRRAALEKVGPMDEGYFLHCEDLDWCMRFRQKGWKIMFVPSVSVIHYQGASSKTRPVFVLWHKHRGMWRFYRKFYQARYPMPFNALVWTGIWARFWLLVWPAMFFQVFRRVA